MSDEIIERYLPMPRPTGKPMRRHKFCKVDRNGRELWVDLTVLRKSRSMDSVPLYSLRDDELLFEKYERASLLRERGVY